MTDDDEWLARRRQVLAARRERPWVGERRPGPQGRTHGRVATYNAGCRCDDCCEALREYRRDCRRRRREAAS